MPFLIGEERYPLPFALLALTGVTGLVDAVSFLGLGHVFTANMTGNVVLLAFAVAGTPGLSMARQDGRNNRSKFNVPLASSRRGSASSGSLGAAGRIGVGPSFSP